MNRMRFRGRFVAVAAVVMLTGLLNSAVAAEGNPRGSGHANITVGDGQTRTFTFAAVEHADGTVTGQGEVNNPSFPIRVHFRIDCLEFVGPNSLIASGPISQSTDHGVVTPGRIAVFAVQDNGAGVNAPPDRITTIPDYEPPKSCDEFSIVDGQLRDETAGENVRTLIPVEAGQIRVQP